MTSEDCYQQLTPEEEELVKKNDELAALEIELSERELDLATLCGELQSFDERYHKIIGSRYSELERIEAQIENYLKYLENHNEFRPSHSLKQLYRQIARQLHPDLADADEERERRLEFMVRVNLAYEKGDEEGLQKILEDWQSSPEIVKGDDIGAQLVRALRKISKCRQRLLEINQEQESIKDTELYQLMNRVLSAQELGQDLLGDMAAHIEAEISEALLKLEVLKQKISS